jgi:hypothetical protein
MKHSLDRFRQFANVLARLTGAAGVHSRNYVRAILATQDTYDSVN